MNTFRDLRLLAIAAALATTSAIAQVVVGPVEIKPPVIAGPVIVATLDWSDAPMGGASHVATPGFNLGATVDAEWAAITNPAANGDDTVGLPDDDGVAFPPLVRGTWVNIQVWCTGAGGFLDAWIDFNRVGGLQPAEKFANAFPLVPGLNAVPVFIPTGIPAGNAYARFRMSTIGGLGPIGFAPNGEVEDYRVPIL